MYCVVNCKTLTTVPKSCTYFGSLNIAKPIRIDIYSHTTQGTKESTVAIKNRWVGLYNCCCHFFFNWFTLKPNSTSHQNINRD